MEIDLYEITGRFERLHPRGEWNWPISCLNDSETQERGFECLNGSSSMTIKHFLFLAVNMKQLNFRHFNTNSKKFCETVNFFLEGAKTAPKRPILFCLVYQGVSAILRQFRIISSEDFQRLPTIPEDCRRFPKTNEDVRRSFLPRVRLGNRVSIFCAWVTLRTSSTNSTAIAIIS